MNRYYVRIDGQETPKSYSYEELKSMGILDFDDIQIRKTLDSNWYSAKYYNFPEAGSPPQVVIDEYGQIHNSSQNSNIQIDEFGQIRGVSNDASNTSSSSTSTSSSDEPGCGIIFLKLLLSAGAIGICIALGAASVGIATPVLAYAGWKSLEAIWSNWD